MPKVTVGYEPNLTPEKLIETLKNGLGDRYDVCESDKLMTPEVMLRRSEWEGVTIKILQQPRKQRTQLRIGAAMPSMQLRIIFGAFGLIGGFLIFASEFVSLNIYTLVGKFTGLLIFLALFLGLTYLNRKWKPHVAEVARFIKTSDEFK